MNMLGAMRETIALMDTGLRRIAEDGDTSGNEKLHIEALDENLKWDHLREMLAKMESGINPQDSEKGFSEGKLGRWLGWAQASVVAMGLASLEDMKEINKRWVDK